MSAGALAQVSIGLESEWGTPVTPSKSISVQPGDGIQTNTDIQHVKGIRSVLAANQGSFKGKQVHEGELEMELIPGNAGYFFLSALGQVLSDEHGSETVVYKHVFSEVAAKKSLTIEQATGELVRRFAGATATGFTLSSKSGESVKLTVPLLAKTAASATAITPANETARVLNFADLKVADGILIGGTAFDETEEVECEYKNGLVFVHTHGSHDPAFRDPGRSEVTGKFSMYLNAATAALHAAALNATTQAIVLMATGDAIGDSSNVSLKITIPRAVLSVSSVPINDEYNKLEIEFVGEYDNATSSLIGVELVNLISAYN